MDKETIKTVDEAKSELVTKVENVFKADIFDVPSIHNDDETVEYLRKDYVIQLINDIKGAVEK